MMLQLYMPLNLLKYIFVCSYIVVFRTGGGVLDKLLKNVIWDFLYLFTKQLFIRCIWGINSSLYLLTFSCLSV